MPNEPAAPESPSVDSPRSKRETWILGGLVALFCVVLLRTAWLSEDAYFTFRSVENWVYGYGARWNVIERVQVYTHPLWFALTSALFFVTRHMAASAFALCFIFTGLTIYLLVTKLNRSFEGTAMALGFLIASKAFVDYSTSGLENPLSHFLLLGFFANFWADEDPDPKVAERRLFITCLYGGGLVCNRMDLGLVLAPALVYALWPPRFSIRRVLAIGLGFSPLIIWEIISLIYYGFLVPNTAYAKLGSGATSEFAILQGTRYFQNSLEWDPVTLVCIVMVTFGTLRHLRERPKHAAAAIGALLYLGYVFKIGGDYMSGRFFSAPLAVAAALLANQQSVRKPVVAVGSVVIAVLAFMAPNPTVLSGAGYNKKRLHTDTLIDDERGYRHYFAGLFSNRKSPFLLKDPWYKKGIKHRKEAEKAGETLVIVNANGGYMGYAAGPLVHYINPYAITDPLLARLPGRVGFVAPGHFWRHPPPGYAKAAVMRGELKDPDLAKYWEDLSLIVSGPIWAKERWAAIWRMHNGSNKHLIEAYLTTEKTYAEVSGRRTHAFSLLNNGATISMGETHTEEVLEVRLERDDKYAIELYKDGAQVYRREVGEKTKKKGRKMVLHRIHFPPEVAAAGYDEVHVIPIDGSGKYRMGRLRVLTQAQVDEEAAKPKRKKPEVIETRFEMPSK